MKALVAMLGLALLAGSATLPAAAQSAAATTAAPDADAPAAGAAAAPSSAAPAASAPAAAAAPVVTGGSPSAPAPGAPPAKVEATIEQIENLISAPPEARIGRELDEGKNKEVLFGDPRRIQQLLGDDPRYVYIPSGGDPMIVPWIRERVIATELLDEAKALVKQGRYTEALAKARAVVEQYAGTDAAKDARDLIKKIDSSSVAKAGGDAPPLNPETPVPPPWIAANTRGVVFSEAAPQESIVLIGDFGLHPGESIPSYPGISVKEITKGMVTYDYQGSAFQVPVEGR